MKDDTPIAHFPAPDIEAEIIRRRDMRGVFTFTIDPADAKDFDDALSFTVLEDGTYQVGVHIADVSHYVLYGDAIDKAAYEKATSIYYVDHVNPMLPEELCNNLCSLRPNEDKLTMSVVFNMDARAQVVKHKVCRTVICSDHRLSYEQAQTLIYEGDTSTELGKALSNLNHLANLLRASRMAAGALDIEQDEIRFTLDETGHPIDIYFKKSLPANHLIEEFMLLANRTIATEMGKRGHAFVYRVHDKPDSEKLEKLGQFRKRLGDAIPPSVIEMLTIRAMAKAVYSTKNIGHYGLAFDYYTHFTSPIRRYPDLMVHRLVAQFILGERTRTNTAPNDLEEACVHCSEMEQMAQQAERDSIKEFQALWIADHLNEEFDGTIVSVTDFGMFVRLDGNCCEGLIHITNIIEGDYMLYDEKNYCLIGEQTGKTYSLGDRLRVKLLRADAEKRQIDFAIADSEKVITNKAKSLAAKAAARAARKAAKASKSTKVSKAKTKRTKRK